MAFKGPSVPHRTSRSLALAKGTSAAGFAGGAMGDGGSAYCASCGCPAADCKGHYKGVDVTPVSRPSAGAKTFK